MTRFSRIIILFLLIPLPVFHGCGKNTPRREGEGSASGKAQENRVSRIVPFCPTAPPPLANGPSAAPSLTPTRHAEARVGTKALYRVIPERGGASRQTIEIVRTDATTAYAHQTAETRKYGQYMQYMSYNRFIEAVPATDRFNPTNREYYIGDRMITVGTKKLHCRVYETRNGSSIYHTLLCDDVPGWIVQHSDNASGVWKTRLQLLDVWD